MIEDELREVYASLTADPGAQVRLIQATYRVENHPSRLPTILSGLLVAAVALGLALVRSDQHERPAVPSSPNGIVTGQAPLCYGPGPGLNLRPRTTIRAVPVDGGPPSSITVNTTNAQHTYRITLAAGTYAIGATGDPTTTVTVQAGATLEVDLPSVNCL